MQELIVEVDGEQKNTLGGDRELDAMAVKAFEDLLLGLNAFVQ